MRARGRDAKGRWLPGTTGNSRGRPKQDTALPASFTDLMRGRLAQPMSTVLGPEAGNQPIGERLVDVLLEEAMKGKDRLRAISAIADRLEGRPRQAADQGGWRDLPTIMGVKIT